MTLPSLIQNNKNKEVEARLKKIYSVMNQAVLFSELDNGSKEYWDCRLTSKNFVEKYFLPYIRNAVEKTFTGYSGENIALYFLDGSILISKSTGSCSYDFFFYPNGKNFDQDRFNTQDEDGNWTSDRPDSGITFFAFRFAPNSDYGWEDKFHIKRGFEPYKWKMTSNTVEATKSEPASCTKNSSNRGYCTALIQLNGWEIPEDYPVKVK